jgi:hypothetical protein
VVGPEIVPFGSGKSAFRFLIPVQQIRKNPATTKLSEREGYMTMWMGDDRRLVMYPCSDNTMMNFVGIHPSELSASKGEGKSGPILQTSRKTQANPTRLESWRGEGGPPRCVQQL